MGSVKRAGQADPAKSRYGKSAWLKSTGLLLFVLYIVMTALRFLLACVTHVYNTVMIDEQLYSSIARSIANGEGLLFMGQPADYASILYPLILAPVYALFPEGTDYFRVIQLWNLCLMNLSIVPVFFLARDITRDRNKAILIAVVTLLLPDMLLGGMVMSEAILYPLFFAMMLFAYRWFAAGKGMDAILTGALGGLIYFAKPGQVVTAVVILAAVLIRGIRKRDRIQILTGVYGAGSLLAVIALSYLVVYGVFRHPSSLLGLYDNQVFSSGDMHLWEFLRALLLSPFCFYLISCRVCLIVPLLKLRNMQDAQKRLLEIILISLAVIAVGTAWAVNRVEYIYVTIHTRYFAHFVPLLLMLSLVKTEESKKAGKAVSPHPMAAKAVWGITLYVLLCLLLFGCAAGVDSSTNIISNIGLAFLRRLSPSAVIALSVFLAAGAAVLAGFVPRMKDKSLERLTVILTLLCFLANSLLAYHWVYDRIDPAWEAEADTIRAAVDEREFVYVYGSATKGYNGYLDPRTSRSVSMVSINDLFNATRETDGVYEPFVPGVQRGTIPQYETPDVDLLVIDKIAMGHLQLSENARMLTRGEMNMQVISIPRGERWVDCFLGGPIDGSVSAGRNCFIRWYRDDLRARPVRVTLEIELKQASSFIIGFNDEDYSFDLPAGRDTYHIPVSAAADGMHFCAPDSDMTVFSFRVETD